MVFVDTDVIVDVFRRYPPALEWLAKMVGEEEIVLPGFVLMELMQGCRDREEQERMKKKVEGYRVAWPTEEECEKATALLTDYHLSTGIGILDVLIGQMALERGVPLHTFNSKHYQSIPGLGMIQPYTRVTT